MYTLEQINTTTNVVVKPSPPGSTNDTTTSSLIQLGTDSKGRFAIAIPAIAKL
jgi:hypothetical protein